MLALLFKVKFDLVCFTPLVQLCLTTSCYPPNCFIVSASWENSVSVQVVGINDFCEKVLLYCFASVLVEEIPQSWNPNVPLEDHVL